MTPCGQAEYLLRSEREICSKGFSHYGPCSCSVALKLMKRRTHHELLVHKDSMLLTLLPQAGVTNESCNMYSAMQDHFNNTAISVLF